MAWLQKQGDIWWLGWRHDGKQFRKSTKQTDKAEAQKQLEEVEDMQRARARGALNSDFYAAVTGRKIEQAGASAFFAAWLTESEPNVTHSTMIKYKQVVREFTSFTEANTKLLLLEDITVEQFTGFIASKQATLAPGTVKGYRRILGSIFLSAHNRGLIKANPAALAAKSRGRSHADTTTKKRPFTLAELKTLSGKATPFWRYMLTAGYFTGQSLGDLITLRAECVDRATNLITMNRRKTGKQVILPISKSLRVLLSSLWPKGRKGYFWPDEAARYLETGASAFSQEFYDLMASVGLVEQRGDKQSAGKGRNAKRAPQKLGFHNLRHTFVTHLKIGGAMDSVARELAGHGSNTVSAVYTHLPAETLTKAISLLPEFVK